MILAHVGYGASKRWSRGGRAKVCMFAARFFECHARDARKRIVAIGKRVSALESVCESRALTSLHISKVE